MKTLLILNFSFLILLSCCRSAQTAIRHVPVETRIEVVERLVEVPIKADSALLVAYLECDSNYNVLIRSVSDQKTAGIQSAFTQSKIENQKSKIEYRVVRVPDTLYIPVRDSTFYKEIPIEIPVPGPQVNYLTGWQYFQIWCGRISILSAIILIAWVIIKYTRR